MEIDNEHVNQVTYRDRGTKSVELPRCRAVGSLNGAELTPEVCGKKRVSDKTMFDSQASVVKV